MLDSLNENTSQHLQLGEGLLLANVSLDDLLADDAPLAAIARAVSDDAHLIGATQEGCIFRYAPNLIHTEARGQRTPLLGAMLSGPCQATLTGTMLAITPANAARLMNAAVPEAAPHTVLAPNAASQPEALTSLCWIGTLGHGLLAIELTSPLSIGGLTFRAGCHGTGEMPFTFLAQQSAPDAAEVPFRMHWLTEVSA